MTRAAAAPSVRTRARALARHPWATAGAIALLVVLSGFVRTGAMDAGYWIDEGLSVGIAGHPLAEIPGVLAQDGSPPLYYVLLHLWMRVAGRGEVATHSLSLLFALAAVPAAYWAARRPFGRRTALICAGAAALTPFLTRYAQETRMYSLMALLSLVATGALLRVLVLRRRRFMPLAAGALALMLYTHNWALFFVCGAAAAVLLLAARHRTEPARARAAVRDGAVTLGVALLAYLPWVPTLVAQARRTGAPWSDRPRLQELAGAIGSVLDSGTVAILVIGGAGLVRLIRRAPADERAAATLVAALTVTTLVTAWLASQISPSWSPRYLAVLVGPLIVVASAGLSRAGRFGLAGAVAVAAFWLTGPAPADDKGNARALGRALEAPLRPGDLVISTQPEQATVIAHYLGPRYRYATTLGPVPDTRVMDWRDAVPRLRAAAPRATYAALLRGVPAGGRIVLLQPRFDDPGSWRAPWTRLVRERSRQWARLAAADPRLRRIRFVTPGPRARAGLRAAVYERVDAQA